MNKTTDETDDACLMIERDEDVDGNIDKKQNKHPLLVTKEDHLSWEVLMLPSASSSRSLIRHGSQSDRGSFILALQDTSPGRR